MQTELYSVIFLSTPITNSMSVSVPERGFPDAFFGKSRRMLSTFAECLACFCFAATVLRMTGNTGQATKVRLECMNARS